MESAVSPFSDYLNEFKFKDATHPIILNRTALPEQSAEKLKENLSFKFNRLFAGLKPLDYYLTPRQPSLKIGPGKGVIRLN